MILKDKDILMMHILEKVTLANNRHLMVLGGYRDPSVTRKRVNNLISEGLVKSDWLGDHLVYTLTQGGLHELEKKRRPYEIGGVRSRHEELVTEAACWLYIRANRGIEDMYFDHEMNSIAAFDNIGHRPDIAFSLHQAVEVELSSKKLHGTSKKAGLEENFEKNALNFTRQIWIIPERKKVLISTLKKLADKYDVTDQTNIITVEQLMASVSKYDASTNEPRLRPVKGLPSPIKKRS